MSYSLEVAWCTLCVDGNSEMLKLPRTEVIILMGAGLGSCYKRNQSQLYFTRVNEGSRAAHEYVKILVISSLAC